MAWPPFPGFSLLVLRLMQINNAVNNSGEKLTLWHFKSVKVSESVSPVLKSPVLYPGATPAETTCTCFT